MKEYRKNIVVKGRKHGNRVTRMHAVSDVESHLIEREKHRPRKTSRFSAKENAILAYVRNIRHAVKISNGGNIEKLRKPSKHGDWVTGFESRAYDRARVAMKELPKLLQESDISPKVKRQAREMLCQVGINE